HRPLGPVGAGGGASDGYTRGGGQPGEEEGRYCRPGRIRRQTTATRATSAGVRRSVWTRKHRCTVCLVTSTPPLRTKRTVSSVSHRYPLTFVPTVTAHRASWSQGSR